jgi:AcrR family transcriptional regulator
MVKRRKYRNTAQAEIAALIRQRIIQAGLALFAEQWIDLVTLDQIAKRAGVTVQTLLRHFGSKEGLGAAVDRAANEAAAQQRAEVGVGDIEGAVDNLIEHYEQIGDRVIRMLAQEERYPQLRDFMPEGRSAHDRWVRRVFAPLSAFQWGATNQPTRRGQRRRGPGCGCRQQPMFRLFAAPFEQLSSSRSTVRMPVVYRTLFWPMPNQPQPLSFWSRFRGSK